MDTSSGYENKRIEIIITYHRGMYPLHTSQISGQENVTSIYIPKSSNKLSLVNTELFFSVLCSLYSSSLIATIA